MSLVAPIVTRGFGEGVHGGAIVTRGYGGGLFVQVLDFLRLAGRRAKEFVPEILYVVKASLEARLALVEVGVRIMVSVPSENNLSSMPPMVNVPTVSPAAIEIDKSVLIPL